MKLLNVGCGAERYGEPWTNLDNLREQLAVGTPERTQLDTEPNYVEHNIDSGPLPFEDDSFDGVLLSHVVEHFDAPAGAALMADCRRLLVPGGALLVSVPDASYFKNVYREDWNENWPRLFGQTDPRNPIPTFFEAALWFDQHKAIFSHSTLWCYFVKAGFTPDEMIGGSEAIAPMYAKLNRLEFSLVMSAVRT